LQHESHEPETKNQTNSQPCDTSDNSGSTPQERLASSRVSKEKGSTKTKTVAKSPKESKPAATSEPEVTEISSRIAPLPGEEAVVKMMTMMEPSSVGQCSTQISRFLGQRDPMEWAGIRNLHEFKVGILRTALTKENELTDPVRAFVWNAIQRSGPSYDVHMATMVAVRAAYIEWVREVAIENFAVNAEVLA
jgi:hypothetical protein